MRAIKLNDGVMPLNPGEYSIQPKMYRPPYGERIEIFMVTPNGQTGALIPEIHTWSFDELGRITIKPSIAYFNYHGHLINDEWTP